jgi:hypothetical protein
MGSRKLYTDDLPPGYGLEVWGDSTVWIVSPNGQDRELLRSYLDRLETAQGGRR